MPRDPPVTMRHLAAKRLHSHYNNRTPMREVAIVGAGELGGAVAHVLARRDVVRSIRSIDETGRVAAGKALDIAQAAPVEGFATKLTGTTRCRDRRGQLSRRRGRSRGAGDRGRPTKACCC